MASSPGPSGRDSVVLHSTWTGIVMAVLGSIMMAVVTIAVLATEGWSWWSGALVVVTTALSVVVLFDLPIAAEFGADAVTRRNLARRHRLRWDDVQRLERLRVGILRTRRRGVGGGLVARIGHRRYVLVDTVESQLEFDAVRRVLGERADVLGLTDDLRPEEGHNPTWLYRRQHWRPDSAGRR